MNHTTEKFMHLKTEIDSYLSELQAISDNHFGCDADTLNEDDVRHLKNLVSLLKKLPKKADIHRKNAPMTYDEALEILEFNNTKNIEDTAERAKHVLNRLPPTSPLRCRVACMVLINAATK